MNSEGKTGSKALGGGGEELTDISLLQVAGLPWLQAPVSRPFLALPSPLYTAPVQKGAEGGGGGVRVS